MAPELLDFTPWRAASLDLLGEAIGFRLEPIEREHPVGQLWLDRGIDYAAGFWKGAASVGLRIQTDGKRPY